MEYNKSIDQFISYCFEPYEEMTYKNYPDYIFWYKSGDFIVEIEKSGYFWLEYAIWKRISDMFGLGYYDTQSVVRVWLEQHYKLGELTPVQANAPRFLRLEQHYKLGELTPRKDFRDTVFLLEQHYDLG